MTEAAKNPAAALAQSSAKFGTIRGVFIPSILTILGVILYLRLGWVLGNVGLTATILIITMSSAITFLTALSMSATATNMKVGGGGAYYMISRSFGVEAGAAIGIPLFLAQAIGISFYCAGFAEAVHSFLPSVPQTYIAMGSLLVLTVLAYVSADLALRTQLFILAVIVASLVVFFLGGGEGVARVAANKSTASFWVAFAVFFPAVTGIEAGMSMSGDLKNPARALPWGTLAAVVVGYGVYVAIVVFLQASVSASVLRANPMVMRDVALFGFLILAGVLAATLSSALGALLGAPRTLQALARDRVVPSFLGTGAPGDDSPRIATAVSFVIAAGGILLGNLDVIAPVLSMFFLTSYGFLNLTAGVEGMIGNPSWRPKFRIHWILSFVGAGGCFATMLMINSGATLIAAFLCTAVFYITRVRNLNARWSDIRRGILTSLARYSVYRLSGFKKNPRSWRPHLLVLSGSPTARWFLIELADAITHGKGFLTVAAIVSSAAATGKRVKNLQSSMREFLAKKGIPALTKAIVADSIFDGASALVRSYGLGPLAPNTLMFGEADDPNRLKEFTKLITMITHQNQNVIIVRKATLNRDKRKRKIDVWTMAAKKENNASFMLTLAYMLQTSPEWKGSTLQLKTIVACEEERLATLPRLHDFLEESRVDAEPFVFVANPKEPTVDSAIRRYSQEADLVFLGMRAPKEGESHESYTQYYQTLLAQTKNFPPTALVLANEGVDFREIFV